MPAYRKLEEGLFELDSPAGPLPVTSSEAELRAAGHYPAMLAQNTQPSDGGISQIPGLGRVLGTGAPPSRLDAQTIAAPPGFAAPVESPESVAASDAEARQVINKAREEQSGARPLRGGGEIREIGEDPAFAQQAKERPRYAKVGGKDIRAGFNIQRPLLDPADVAAAEEAESEASIQRKLATQTLAERDAARAETISAEMGRQVRAEQMAIRDAEARAQRLRQDFEERQGAIDAERARVEALEVKPEQYGFERGDLAGIIGGLTVLAASVGQAYQGGPNLALEALRQKVEDKVRAQREQYERGRQGLHDRENEFGRMVQIFGTPEAAEEELRDRSRLLIQRMGEKLALDAGATDAAEHLKMQFAAWDNERAQSRLARQQALAGTITEQHQHIPERVVQVGGPRPRTEEQRKRLVRVGGQEGYVVAESDRRPVQETVSTLEHLEGQLDRLAQIVEQTGVGDIEKQRQVESLVGSLGPALSVAQGQGAMSDDERKAVENRLGNAQSLIGNKDRARTLIGETKQFFGEKKGTVVRGSVYADPDATTPLMGSQSQRRRYE